MRCNDSTSSPKSSFLKLMKVFIGSWNTPVVSISLSVFPSRCAVLFSPLRYHLGASANFANLQGLHLLLNRCWWQVSPRILIGSCIMSKNDGAGLEAAKVTQSHPFTQTNGINESSLSGTPPPLPPTPPPDSLSPPLCHTLLAAHYPLSSLWRDAFHCRRLSSCGPVTEQLRDPGKRIVIFIGSLRNVPVPFSQLSFIKSV